MDLLLHVDETHRARSSDTTGDGQLKAAGNLLDAFRNQLAAQRGKHVSETAFERLDAAAAQLLVTL